MSPQGLIEGYRWTPGMNLGVRFYISESASLLLLDVGRDTVTVLQARQRFVRPEGSFFNSMCTSQWL